MQSPRTSVTPTAPAPRGSSHSRSRADGTLVQLSDCAKGLGIGLNKSNVITELTPGGAAARSGLLRLGDRVVAVDGTALEGDRVLQDVMRPAASHSLELVRGNGVATRGIPSTPIDWPELDFADPNLSPSAQPTPPPSPPSSAPLPTSVLPPPSSDFRSPTLPPPRRDVSTYVRSPRSSGSRARQEALQAAHDRAAALARSSGGASSGLAVPLEMQPTYTGDPLEMQPTHDNLEAYPVSLDMSRGDGGGLGWGLGLGHMKAAFTRQMEADQAAAVGAGNSLAEVVEAAQAQESLKTTAPPRLRRLSTAAKLVKQGEWGEISQHSAAATKQGLIAVIREARDRHSVLQVAAPRELDKHGRDMDDPFRLRDMQTFQASPTHLPSTTFSLLPLATPCYSLLPATTPSSLPLEMPLNTILIDLLEHGGGRGCRAVHVESDQHEHGVPHAGGGQRHCSGPRPCERHRARAVHGRQRHDIFNLTNALLH